MSPEAVAALAVLTQIFGTKKEANNAALIALEKIIFEPASKEMLATISNDWGTMTPGQRATSLLLSAGIEWTRQKIKDEVK